MRMTTRLRWAGATALATSSLVVACNLGDDFSLVTPGFPGSAGGFLDAGVPTEQPSICDVGEGDGCSFAGIETCEMKEHANPACNPTLHCERSTWQRKPPTKSSCASACPESYVVDPDTSSSRCALPNAQTLICEYPEGTCGCAPVRPVEHDAGDAGDAGEEPADAGESDAGDVDAGSTVYAWRCVRPEAGCPRMRPRIGTECVRPMTCDYGDCLFEDGVTMRCYSGSWVSETRCYR